VTLTVADHPLLDLTALRVRWDRPLASIAVPAWLDALCGLSDAPPFPAPGQAEVDAVRALLRHGGFRPSGRSKPCSEYIRAAARDGRFPRINAMVDLTNAAALHGALPVSTVDPDRLAEPLSVGIAPPGSRYVFNASGQEIDLGGLLCLFDAAGPAANAVKDAQRAKTTPDTTATLTLIWGTTAMPGRAEALARGMADRAAELGGSVERVR
jgi:DNA/RNA-binding domain of Phe-tRNA-synthetase-like protein